MKFLTRLCGINVLTIFALSTENWIRPKVSYSSLISFEIILNFIIIYINLL